MIKIQLLKILKTKRECNDKASISMNRAKSEIRQLSQKIIDNRIDFVEGCRKIAQLSHCLNHNDVGNLNEHLLFIRGVALPERSLCYGKS